MPNYIIEEFDPDFPWWEECEDHEDYQEAVISCNRMAEAWPESRFRVIKIEKNVLYTKGGDND